MRRYLRAFIGDDPVRYSIGLDFGTLSVRAVVTDTADGRTLGEAVRAYPHAVMDKALPCGTPLEDSWALAHPADYPICMREAVRAAVSGSGIEPADIVGMCLDCTSATVLPLDSALEPLCLRPAFAEHPHAWPKLWKHHGAEDQAERIRRAAEERGERFLTEHGGQVSCELMLPKALETAERDPALWRETAYYMEMGDWLVSRLTGRLCRARTMAACNACWSDGYPSDAFWDAVSPGIGAFASRLGGELVPLGSAAGFLTETAADDLGLPAGIPVAAALIDSHAAVLGCGAARAGDLTAVIGTSACWLLNAERGACISGIYSSAWEANAPGLYGLEGGQSCVGDGLDWFVRSCVPACAAADAQAAGVSVHAYLSAQAAQLPPGGNGVTALDWLNGVRSPLFKPALKAAFIGLTAHTMPAELYRAAIEACCFGARRVVDCYRGAGLPVTRVIATGGIPNKNPFFMQTLADVLGTEVRVCASTQAGALGSAVLGAAVSRKCGDLRACMERMAAGSAAVYAPNSTAAYDALYARFLKLSEFCEFF